MPAPRTTGPAQPPAGLLRHLTPLTLSRSDVTARSAKRLERQDQRLLAPLEAAMGPEAGQPATVGRGGPV